MPSWRRLVKFIDGRGTNPNKLYLYQWWYNTFMTLRKWKVANLKRAVESSTSFRQILVKLHLKPAGGNYEQIKKYINELNLPISHLKGRGWSAGLVGVGRPRIPLDKILISDRPFQSYKLKKRLFAAGLKPEYCEECKWAKRTDSGHLPLELHHINGNPHDNRLDNLKILCPNCHSMTDNHRSRRRV
jgi:hypothetical protein